MKNCPRESARRPVRSLYFHYYFCDSCHADAGYLPLTRCERSISAQEREICRTLFHLLLSWIRSSVRVEFCGRWKAKGKGRQTTAAPPHTRQLGTSLGTNSYRRAPAAADLATAGIIPAIFMLSMRFRIFSMLAPVSTHASTYGCRVPSACSTSTLISAFVFFAK